MCASQPELKSIFGTSTQLELLRFETNKEEFSNPRIDMHQAFPRYITEMAHEAGYDAFMTGAAFLKLTSFLDKSRNPEKYPEKEEVIEKEEEVKPKKVDADGWDISESEDEAGSSWNINEEEEVFNYGSTKVNLVNPNGKVDYVLEDVINKAALVRTAYDYFDFGKKETISVNSNVIRVSYPVGTEFTKETALPLLSKYGKYIVEDIDDSSSFVVFENLREPVVVEDKTFTIETLTE